MQITKNNLLFLFLLNVFPLYAQPIVRVIPNEIVPQSVILENNNLRIGIDVERAAFFNSFYDKAKNIEYVDPMYPAPIVHINNTWHLLQLGFNNWEVKKIQSKEASGIEVRYFSNAIENANQLFIRIMLGATDELYLDIKIKSVVDSAKHDLRYLPRPSLTSGLNFLNYMVPPKGKNRHVIFKKGLLYFHNDTTDVGMYFLRQIDAPVFPTVVSYPDANAGLLLHKEYSDINWSFNTADEALSFMRLTPLSLGGTLTVFKGILKPIDGDWHTAFMWWKEKLRSSFDFTYYRRKGHHEYRKKILGNFTMVFDHEFYDPVKNEYRLDDFLSRGIREFGGYDFILFWHAYPRIGFDPRDQWEMYQGLPGGIEGIKQLVHRANKKNVWLFLSYNPWDVIGNRKSLIEAQAEIMKQTDANGTYLDIMRGADPTLRKTFDAVDTDIVFSSENRPSWDGLVLSTGSQEDHDYVNEMPRLDLLKFVLPEHNISNTERASRNRTAQIRNALFNFVGFTVWEDIFGEINRYSWDERILIHRYNSILHDYMDAYLDTMPIPLIQSNKFLPSPGKDPFVTSNPSPRVWYDPKSKKSQIQAGMYINQFHGINKTVFSLYHLDHDKIDRYHDNRPIGRLFKTEIPNNYHAVNVWDGLPATIEKDREGVWISSEYELPDPSTVFVVTPSVINVQNGHDTTIVTVPKNTKGFLRLVEMDTEHRQKHTKTVLASEQLAIVHNQASANVYGYIMVQFVENNIIKDVTAIKIK